MAQELYNQTFSVLTEAEHTVTREDAEERYLSYAFLRQSGTQHGNLKVDLQNDFTTGDNRYPKNRQQTLHLLKNYSKTVVQRTTQSEGMEFVQGGRGHRCERGRDNRGGRGNKSFDKEYWKDKYFSITIRRDIHQRVYQKQKRTLTMHLFHLGPAKQKV